MGKMGLACLVELNTGLTTDVVVLLALPYVRPGAQLESMLSHEITQGSTTQASSSAGMWARLNIGHLAAPTDRPEHIRFEDN